MYGGRGDSTLRDRGVARRGGEVSVGSVRAGEDHSLGLDTATWHQSNTWRCRRGSQKRAAVRREAGAGDGQAGVRRDSVKIRDWTRSPRKGAQILQEAKTHFPTLRSQSDCKSLGTCPTRWPGHNRLRLVLLPLLLLQLTAHRDANPAHQADSEPAADLQQAPPGPSTV